ncbi:phage tail protein [Thalassiella azotivora]
MTSTGWLLRQLPRAMQEDQVLAGFVLALEQVSDSVRERVDGAEHLLDPDLATPEMLRYVAAWLAVDLEPGQSPERQRALLRAVGRTLPWRGTRFCLEEVVSAATGARTVVTDAGGVLGPRDDVPPHDPTVVVRVDHAGDLTDGQLLALVRGELPVGAVARLEVAGRAVGEDDGHEGYHPEGEDDGT